MSLFVWYLVICYVIGVPASFLLQDRTTIGNVRCPSWLYKVYTSLWSPILVPSMAAVGLGIGAVAVVCCPFEWICNKIGRLKDRLMPILHKWSFHLPEEKVTIRFNRRGDEGQAAEYLKQIIHDSKLKQSGNQMRPELRTEEIIINPTNSKLKGTWRAE